MTDAAEDPRARFRQLPEPVRPDELVETSDTTTPVVIDEGAEPAWRVAMLGGGMP